MEKKRRVRLRGAAPLRVGRSLLKKRRKTTGGQVRTMCGAILEGAKKESHFDSPYIEFLLFSSLRLVSISPNNGYALNIPINIPFSWLRLRLTINCENGAIGKC